MILFPTPSHSILEFPRLLNLTLTPDYSLLVYSFSCLDVEAENGDTVSGLGLDKQTPSLSLLITYSSCIYSLELYFLL